jgi:hypothetical protein
VSVISACIKGDMACARAAGLLCLSVRQIKRPKGTFSYLCLLRQRLRRHGVPLAFYGDHSGVFVRYDDHWRWKNS